MADVREAAVYNHQLDVFLAVAESGSISAAAREAFTSQPSVTRQIAALESHLGTQLFERTNHGVRLTEAGRLLRDRARQIIALCNETEGAVRSLGSGGGALQLTVASDIMIHEFFCTLVSRFVRAHPTCTVSFKGDQNVLDAIADGAADLGVYCDGPSLRASGLRFEKLFEDREYCLVSAGSPLARRTSLCLDDLDGCTILLPPAGYADSGDLIRQHAAARPGVCVFKEPPDLNESSVVQTVASNPSFVDVVLAHHMKTYPGLVAIPFEGFAKAAVGIVYRPSATAATLEFLEVARAWAREHAAEEANPAQHPPHMC